MHIEQVIAAEKDGDLQRIGKKIVDKERITPEEGVILFEKASLPYLGALANFVRERLHGHKTYFNRNFHIEPTNICVFACNFCSYSRLYAHREEGWELTADQMLNIVKSYDGKPVTEVHIVGGVHPKLTLEFFADLLRKNKSTPPRPAYKSFHTCGTRIYVSKGEKVDRRRTEIFEGSRSRFPARRRRRNF